MQSDTRVEDLTRILEKHLKDINREVDETMFLLMMNGGEVADE